MLQCQIVNGVVEATALQLDDKHELIKLSTEEELKVNPLMLLIAVPYKPYLRPSTTFQQLSLC